MPPVGDHSLKHSAQRKIPKSSFCSDSVPLASGELTMAIDYAYSQRLFTIPYFSMNSFYFFLSPLYTASEPLVVCENPSGGL